MCNTPLEMLGRIIWQGNERIPDLWRETLSPNATHDIGLRINGMQDAVSAQQRSFARAMKKRQAAAGDSSAKSMSHSAGARLYDQSADAQESNGPAKSLSNRTISNGAVTIRRTIIVA